MGSKRTQRGWERSRGTAYVEYFLAAAALFTATMWLFNSGNLQGARAVYEKQFNSWMGDIAGKVTPDVP